MRKVLKKLHLWLSIPFGVIIMVLCLSGAAMALDADFHRWFYPSLYQVEQMEKPLSLEQLNHQFFTQTGKPIDRLVTTESPKQSLEVYQAGDRTTYYVNPYTGEILGSRNKMAEGTFFRQMFFLHRFLMDAPETKASMPLGRQIVGYSTLALVVIVLTGLFLWLPRAMRNLKKSLVIEHKKGTRRFLYDLHVGGGVYTLVIVLVMALTGMMWSFKWYSHGVYTLLGVEPIKHSSAPKGEKKAKTTVDYAVWQQALQEVKTKYDSYVKAEVSQGQVKVYPSSFGNVRASDTYQYSPLSGKIMKEVTYDQSSPGMRVMGWAYSLHTGNFGGLFTRIVFFLASIFGAVLVLTGYYLWAKRVF